MKYNYSDKEIDVKMEYHREKFAPINKYNGKITIEASGDFNHHMIEGIIKALKTIQEQNPHLGDA